MVKVLGNNTFLDETKLIKMVVLSGFVHFLAIFLFVFLPNLSSRPTIRIIPQYTPVALVGPGELGGGGKSSVKPVTVPKARVNVAVKKPELIQKKVEPKPIEISKAEPKTATSPKEATHNSQAQEQQVNQAIENIRERVGGEEQAANTGGVGIGVTQEGGGSGAPEMVVYMSIVVDRIMEAWFLPPGLKEQAINQGLLTTIDIRIDREGKVSFQAIEQSSGNSVYDDFALKAIQKIQVTSFPPLPEVYREPYLDLGIKFNPSEVNS